MGLLRIGIATPRQVGARNDIGRSEIAHSGQDVARLLKSEDNLGLYRGIERK